MWWNRVTSACRDASSMAWVPRTLVRKKRPGSRMARELWDSAAKWTTVSIEWLLNVSRANPTSQMSPRTKLIRSSMSARDGLFPAYVRAS